MKRKNGIIVALFVLCVVVCIALVCLKENRQRENVFYGEKQVDIYTLKYEYSCKGKEGSVIMQADVPKVSGEGYEKVAEAIEQYYSVDELQDNLQTMYQEGQTTMETRVLECTRMDDAVISFKKTVHYFENGGFTIQEGRTFSAKNGEVLELDELLSDKDAFYSVIDDLIVEELLNQYPEIAEQCVGYRDIYNDNYRVHGKLPEWYLEKTGTAFSFKEMEFLSRNYGCMSVVIPYDKVRGGLKQEYVWSENVTWRSEKMTS